MKERIKKGIKEGNIRDINKHFIDENYKICSEILKEIYEKIEEKDISKE